MEAIGPGILSHAARGLRAAPDGKRGRLPSAVLDDEGCLDHKGQVISALALDMYGRTGTENRICKIFGKILGSDGRATARKVSLLLALTDLLERSETRISAKSASGKASIDIVVTGPWSARLQSVMEKISRTFGIELDIDAMSTQRTRTEV